MFSQICVWIVVLQFIRFVLPWLYKNFIGPHFFGDRFNFKKYGEWAVVTGASDGIGKEFTKQLASKGLNVVLISRSLQKLEKVASEIQKKYKVKTLVIDVDFTNGLGIYDTIQQKIKGLDIGILVNNVGVGYSGPDHFHELAYKDNFLWDMLACNVISISFMTKQVINCMLKKKKGLIVNISSLAATTPYPMCLYSSTKAYVDKFTEDFNIEYQNSSIAMQSFNPGPVKTNIWTDPELQQWIRPNAETYVASAMRFVGMGSHTIGYYPHALLQLMGRLVQFLFPYFYEWSIWIYHKRLTPQK